MNYIDLILIVIIAIAFILGFKDGFVRKLIGTIGFLLAVFLSITFSTALGEFVFKLLGIELYFAEILAGVIIFFATITAFSFLKRVVHPFDKVNSLINRLMGGISGLLQILFFLSALLYLLGIFEIPDKDKRKESLLYKPVYSLVPKTIDFLKTYIPDPKSAVKNIIIEKDTLK